jgi:hypothetical protein
MAIKRLASVLGLLGLGGVLAIGSAGLSQQPPDQPQAAQNQPPVQQEGLDVLATGPIHEAYAEPVDYNPKPTPVVAKQPPDPIEEVPPDQKPEGENVEWIPGYWFWDDGRNDYVWVSGIWRVPPPDQQWVPGYWNQVQGGWQWVPGFWLAVQDQGQQQGQEEQVQIQYLPPPPEPLQAAPSTPQPDPNSVFVPGTWVYATQETRYVWRPGYWVDYQPGWIWVPARYCWTPAGYVFADGHWDYELQRRGLMFAPIYFRERLWLRPSWYYQPSYAVYPDYLLSCLFVRPQAYCYYFGDYFSNTYVRLGFVPWVDFRIGRVGYDPLFSYYRWAHRDDRRWVNDIRTVYESRFRGELPRPPRTLRDQITLVNNINVRNTNVNINQLNLVNGVAPLTKVNQTFVSLRPVTREERTAHQQFAREVVKVSRERQQTATQLLSSGAIPRRPTDRPQVARVPVPRPPLAAREAERSHSDGRPQTIPGTNPVGRPVQETRPQTRPEARPETRPENRPQNRPGAAPENQPRPETRPQARPEPRPEQRPEPRPQTRPESRPPQQPQPGAEPTPQPRPESRPQQPETRPAPQPQPRPEARPQPQPQPRPETRPAPPPQQQPRPETRPAPQPQPRPEARPQPQPQPRPEARPQPQPQPRPEARPQPQRPQPPPRPDRPQQQAQPRPQPQPKPPPQQKPQEPKR